MNNFLEILQNHRSIRRYKNIPVEKNTLTQIIKSAQCSSTSSHFQAYTIINVIDSDKRLAISQAAGGQRWIVEAPVFLVFCADLYRAKKHWINKQDRVFSNNEMFIVATVDATLAAQQAFIAAESLGLGGVFVGGIRNDLQKICDVLQLPELVYPVFGVCLGYPDDNPELKPRLPMDIIFKTDSYNDESDNKLIAQYNKEVEQYYIKRTGGEQKESWSERCSRLMMEKTRDGLGQVIQKQGFNKSL